CALIENLLRRQNLARLIVLQRNNSTQFNDPRVTIVNFDAEDAASIATAAQTVQEAVSRVHLMINTVGMLHTDGQQPEKRLKDFDPANLQRSFAINAALLPALVKAFGGLLRHPEPALVASLSARVGSIEDNDLGGWYSYRASKAAHNMLLRTIAHEWRVSHRNAVIVALHPGTVHSPLSQPFISSGYKNTVHTPADCAEHLLGVLSNLTGEASGGFYDWKGDTIPW
ncbi:MAG: SDR family NAD(P)-dependent oxidoreductase, partial [Halioglobus sp.]|nr:SDR family NAD(P)-dependent oxidoreductase [Halioglobus sp.]